MVTNKTGISRLFSQKRRVLEEEKEEETTEGSCITNTCHVGTINFSIRLLLFFLIFEGGNGIEKLI